MEELEAEEIRVRVQEQEEQEEQPERVNELLVDFLRGWNGN